MIEYANGEKGTKDEKKTFLGKIFAVCFYSKISKIWLYKVVANTGKMFNNNGALKQQCIQF